MPPEERSPNYITKAGATRLQKELRQLWSTDRPKIVQEVADAAAQGDRSENAEYIYGKKKLREIDRRIRFLKKRLQAATVVEPHPPGTPKVYFGATVELENDDGERQVLRIVGEDEIDADRGDVSWRSPIGRAVLGKEAGATVRVRKPSGEAEFTLLRVDYVAPGGATPTGETLDLEAIDLSTLED
jgi:transcription elongation factor GreB